MKKTAQFLVDRRKGIFLFMMCLAVVSVILIPRVNVNTDMTRYLPESSAMKQGIDLLAQEFSGLSMPNTVRVMFRDVPEEEKEAVRAKLKETPHVQSVSFLPGDPRSEKDGYSLYTLEFSVGYDSPEMQEAEDYIMSEYAESARNLFETTVIFGGISGIFGRKKKKKMADNAKKLP